MKTIEKAALAVQVKDQVVDFKDLLDELPPGREKSLAITKIEECEMWAARAIDVAP